MQSQTQDVFFPLCKSELAEIIPQNQLTEIIDAKQELTVRLLVLRLIEIFNLVFRLSQKLNRIKQIYLYLH